MGGSLPAPLTRILGRDGVIAGLTAQLSQRRFLTIVGPGGVGKTTVAIAVAQSVSASYKDGVWFVGLSSLAVVSKNVVQEIRQGSLLERA